MPDSRDITGDEPVDLESLEQEFQMLLARMQTGEHSEAVDALFDMPTEELGQAAVESPSESG